MIVRSESWFICSHYQRKCHHRFSWALSLLFCQWTRDLAHSRSTFSAVSSHHSKSQFLWIPLSLWFLHYDSRDNLKFLSPSLWSRSQRLAFSLPSWLHLRECHWRRRFHTGRGPWAPSTPHYWPWICKSSGNCSLTQRSCQWTSHCF